MVNFTLIANFILIGSTGYASYAVKLEHPFAFVACAFAFGHGLLSMIQSMNDEESKVKEISDSIMEILPISLVNIELYNGSSLSGAAAAHWFFIIPLTFDMIARLFTEEGEDSSAKALKDITIIGNVGSLSFLAFNEEKYIYAGLAAMLIMSKYGSFVMQYIKECATGFVAILCEAIFYIVLALALGEGGEGGGGGE